MARKKKAKPEKEVEVKVEESAIKPSLPVIEEIIPKPSKNEDDVDVFIRQQLKVINNMQDTAKAKRLAARVLRNKRKG